MTSPNSLTLRGCLWLVRLSSTLLPEVRRRDWVETWEAELWHRTRRLQDEGTLTVTNNIDLVLRSGGAVTHAVWLAARERSPIQMGNDLRYALRGLLRNPGFTTVALMSLTLAIGANAIAFSIVDGVLLHPFPYPDEDRLLVIGNAFPKIDRDLGFIETNAAREFLALREQSETLEHFLTFDLGNRDLSGIDDPQRLFTAFVVGDPFRTLGMTPHLGRGFLDEEIRRGDPVIVLSYRVWQQRFAGDSSAVGRTALVNGVPQTIVGIMPDRLLLLETDMWQPWSVNLLEFPPSARPLNIMARVREGVSLADVQVEIGLLGDRFEAAWVREFPEYEGWSLAASSMTDVYASFVGPAGNIVLWSVGLVLLIACTNIASLLLARGSKRSSEIAIRMALGAERRRIVQQLLVESVVLAGVGGVLGLTLAIVGTGFLLNAIPSNFLPGSAVVGVNARVLGYTAILVLGSGVVFGVLPAIQNSKGDVKSALASGAGRGSASTSGAAWRRVFVVSEIALAVILLAGASLMIQSFRNLQGVESGVDATDILTMRLTLARERFDGNGVVTFFDQLVDRVGELPGVRMAAVTSQFPPAQRFANAVLPERDRASTAGESLPTALGTIVHPNLFATLGMTVRQGRGLDDRDVAGATPTVVVNEAFAREHFPDGDVVGQRFSLGRDGDLMTIVGVVSDVRNVGLENPPRPEFFGSLMQSMGRWNQLFLLVKTESDALSSLPSVRAAVLSLDADQPVYAIQTLDQRYSDLVAPNRLTMTVLMFMGIVAMGLAAVGVYGVMSSTVGARTQEIGLRVALGATSTSVVKLVVMQALKLIGLGVSVGIAGAFFFSRFLESLLFEIVASDPLTFFGVGAVLFLVALLAGWLPARRAAGMDPVSALNVQ